MCSAAYGDAESAQPIEGLRLAKILKCRQGPGDYITGFRLFCQLARHAVHEFSGGPKRPPMEKRHAIKIRDSRDARLR